MAAQVFIYHTYTLIEQFKLQFRESTITGFLPTICIESNKLGNVRIVKNMAYSLNFVSKNCKKRVYLISNLRLILYVFSG